MLRPAVTINLRSMTDLLGMNPTNPKRLLSLNVLLPCKRRRN